MPFSNSNDYTTGRKPAPFPSGTDLLAVRFTLDVKTTDLAINTAGAIGILPAGCVPVDVHVDGTDLDTGAAAMVLQVGILNAAGTDLSSAAADGGGFWGSTVAANTAFHQRIVPNLNAIPGVQMTQADRFIGIKVATAPTTPQAGTIGATLFYRAP